MTLTKLLLLPGAFLYCAAMALGRIVRKHKLGWALGFAAVALWALTYDVGDNTVFEIDANATTDHPVNASSHDWDQVYADSQMTPPGTSSGALAFSFDPDSTNSGSDNIFQGGGSKDNQGIQKGAWLYTAGKPQGKDDIAHAYAAAYNIPANCGTTGQPACHLGLFFGVDRYDNSGDATMGFWFFQDPTVGLTTTRSQGGLKFSGVHKDGDLLIIADFTVGGSISTPIVYRWVGDDATGSLQGPVNLLPGQSKVEVNGGPTPSPWPFTDKSGNHSFAQGEFLEGGVDLNAIYGASLPCLSTFMAETRSSTSTSATLSDFTPPKSFPLCGISVTKTCDSASIKADGKTITYNFSGMITNTGIAPVTNVSISDVPGVPACSATVTQSCYTNLTVNPLASTSLDAKAMVSYSGSFDTNFVSSSLPNTATASAATPEGTPLTASASWLTGNPATLPGVCIPSPSGTLALTKSCAVTSIDSSLGIHVHFTGTVTNNASVEVSAITVTDTPEGGSGTSVLSGQTLAPGVSASFSGDYQAVTCTPLNSTVGNVTIQDLGKCQFQDTVTATGTGALGYTLPSVLPNTAMCNLCPGGTDANGKSYCAGN